MCDAQERLVFFDSCITRWRSLISRKNTSFQTVNGTNCGQDQSTAQGGRPCLQVTREIAYNAERRWRWQRWTFEEWNAKTHCALQSILREICSLKQFHTCERHVWGLLSSTRLDLGIYHIFLPCQKCWIFFCCAASQSFQWLCWSTGAYFPPNNCNLFVSE